MNKAEKKEFIESLCNSIANRAISNLDKMPDEWDGHELRQHISELADNSAMWRRLDRKRKNAFNNTCMVNGIY